MLLLSFVLCLFINGCYAQTPVKNRYPHNTSANSANGAVFNEYEWYQNTHAASNVEYIRRLKRLAKYSKNELIARKYSAEKIEIVEKLRKDPRYVPSDEELTLAGSTLRFYCVCSDSRVRDNNSSYDFIWSFQWSDTPLYQGTDIIAFHWIGDFYMDEISVDAEISYHSDGTVHTEDLAKRMKLGIIPNKKACTLSFPAKWESDSSALRGRGSFRMCCTDHRHSDINMGWGYGKLFKAASEQALTFGDNSPSIAFGDSTHVVVTGNRTYFTD